MAKWMVQMQRADFAEWARALGVDPVIARVIRNRGITTVEEASDFLYGGPERMHSPYLLPDMERAVQTILEGIRDGLRIRVIGDYDADGVTSTYILTKGLGLLGANVDAAIPHRIHDGYGLNDNMVNEAHEAGIQMIITCDNGIAAADQIALANSYGMRCVVTDHHEIPFEDTEDGRVELLPPAEAVVDPKRGDSSYPFPGICGAMIAYKLMQALLERTSCHELASSMEELQQFAAIGTVCDVMELLNENRILVRLALRSMGRCSNPGLKALIRATGLEAGAISAYSIGFVLGPCINATGRLDTAEKALELFRAESYEAAMPLAVDLKEMNDNRKTMTEQGVADAFAYVETHRLMEQSVWLIYLPTLHESLAGIVAGKVRERYHHPVFVLTRGEEGLKGSGRSIENYHMYRQMHEVAPLFTKYGGHALAAGFSIAEENLEPLRAALNANSPLTDEDYVEVYHIDVPMPLSYANMHFAQELKLLEPTGTGNRTPLFAEKNVIFRRAVTNAKNTVTHFTVLSGKVERDLTAFGSQEAFFDALRNRYGASCVDELREGRGTFLVSVLYTVSENVYRGQSSLQMIMKDYLIPEVAEQ